jgi:DNA-binding MarR family transcriptional regulator
MDDPAALTPDETAVLFRLVRSRDRPNTAQDGPDTARALSQDTGLTLDAVLRSLASLQERGFVRASVQAKWPDPLDRTAYAVTEAGAAALPAPP